MDQYLNIKLSDISVVGRFKNYFIFIIKLLILYTLQSDGEKYPQLIAINNCFIRGSVVRYIQIPAAEVDTELLQDAARKENSKT